MEKNIPNSISYLIAKITGFCSIIYLLFFAEILLNLYDSTQAYSLSIGIFILGILIGSYYISKFNYKSENIFLLTEFGIAILSLVTTLILILVYQSYLSLMPSLIITFLFIIGIGILTGFESELIHKHNKNTRLKNIYLNQIIGLVFGSFVFALIILPYFDLFSALVLVGFLNILIAAIYIIIRDKLSGKFKFDIGEILTILLLIGYIYLAFLVPEFTLKIEDLIFGGFE